jgi:hypothetical protein
LIGASQHPFSQLRRHFPRSHAAPSDAVHLRIEAKPGDRAIADSDEPDDIAFAGSYFDLKK